MNDTRIPVTVLTGFLGAGKTTLLNRILTEKHGHRIAVIENEFGEVGVDQALVIGVEEEIFQMNNGCICCTVRGDLIRILTRLLRRRDQFDAILIETTGLADPGPVVQTFFVDPDLEEALRLDAVVTIVDARHVLRHLDDAPEVQKQIAFADVMLLNKIDLVGAAEIEQIESRIRSMNPTAAIVRTEQAAIELDKVLGIDGFSLDRALEIEPQFLEAEYPFNWSGDIEAAGPALTLGFAGEHHHDHDHDDHHHHHHGMQFLVLPVDEFTERQAVLGFVTGPRPIASGESAMPGVYYALPSDDDAQVRLALGSAGRYRLYFQHEPGPDRLTIHDGGRRVPIESPRHYRHQHRHDDEVASIGIVTPGDLDLDRLNGWLGDLLATRGPDIYRMKGVLAVAGFEERFIFQGIHMLFSSAADRPWGNERRENRLIFIGKHLDRDELRAGFQSCLVAS